MEREWGSRGQAGTEIYSPDQVALVLEEVGVEIDHDTDTHFKCFCPFHNNTETTAFAVHKTEGSWICFNPGCGVFGDLLEALVMRLTDKTIFEARRLILKHKNPDRATRKAREFNLAFDFVPFPEEPVDRMYTDFWDNDRAFDYMRGRGFDHDTLNHFKIGYSEKQDSIITPMHDPTGVLIGFVGRSIEGKDFKNTKGLPKSRTAWNFHRAKATGDTVIIVESAFDAMRVHQAGYPNVIALLGGSLSENQKQQIDKVFQTIIIMTDFESEAKTSNPCATCRSRGFMMCQGHRAGRELGKRIVAALPYKRIMWAAYDDTCVYPHGAKDAGDMNDDEIRQCLHNAVSNFAYTKWAIESVPVP